MIRCAASSRAAAAERLFHCQHCLKFEAFCLVTVYCHSLTDDIKILRHSLKHSWALMNFCQTCGGGSFQLLLVKTMPACFLLQAQTWSDQSDRTCWRSKPRFTCSSTLNASVQQPNIQWAVTQLIFCITRYRDSENINSRLPADIWYL